MATTMANIFELAKKDDFLKKIFSDFVELPSEKQKDFVKKAFYEFFEEFFEEKIEEMLEEMKKTRLS